MGPFEADIELIRQRKSSLIRIRGEKMSRKEVRDALKALKELIERHQGEWSKDRLVAEFAVRHGYRKEKVEQYLDLLKETGQITIRELSVYIGDKERPVEEEKK